MAGAYTQNGETIKTAVQNAKTDVISGQQASDA
jgi:hypothetical protein